MSTAKMTSISITGDFASSLVKIMPPRSFPLYDGIWKINSWEIADIARQNWNILKGVKIVQMELQISLHTSSWKRKCNGNTCNKRCWRINNFWVKYKWGKWGNRIKNDTVIHLQRHEEGEFFCCVELELRVGRNYE